MFEHHHLVDPMKWGAITFWGWCPTSQSHTLTFGENGFSNYVKKLQSLVKKTQGILGIKGDFSDFILSDI